MCGSGRARFRPETHPSRAAAGGTTMKSAREPRIARTANRRSATSTSEFEYALPQGDPIHPLQASIMDQSQGDFMKRSAVWLVMWSVGVGGCVGVDEEDTSTTEQHGVSMQGVSMQGVRMQGVSMQGFRFDGVTLSGAGLTNVRVQKGEVVAESGATTLRGTQLNGAHFYGSGVDNSVSPPAAIDIEFRVT